MAKSRRAPTAPTQHSEPHHPPLVEWLSTPAAFPQPTQAVRRVETHISWVFLTDRFAYKLKKPVRFDFLDFSTLQRRQQYCGDEVRLNRRLAPQVYLGLVAVRQNTQGQFWLDESTLDRHESELPDAKSPTLRSGAASDRIVDWLVKMRRLDESATLESHIRAGQATDGDADVIAGRLAKFFRSMPGLPIEPWRYRADFERHVRGNFAELLRPEHTLNATAVKRIHGAQFRLLLLRPQLFDARVKAGRIVDGHGDLLPEHIYLLPGGDGSADGAGPQIEPVMIDCIEFNAEFRRVDVADELEFLAAECDFLGAEALGRRIFDQTLAALGDQPPEELMAFYRSYRACVRGKVAALRAAQQEGEIRAEDLAEAQRHLQWADQYDRQLPPPVLMVMSGLMGSGKSTLGRELAARLGAEILATDDIRFELFGRSREPAAYGAGHYRPEDRRRVYDEMFARADRLLGEGVSVILDGAFPQAELRMAALEIARRRKLPNVVIHCWCPDEVARQRMTSRLAAGGSASEARPELYEQQKAEEEPNPPEVRTIEIDSTLPDDDQVAQVLEEMGAD